MENYVEELMMYEAFHQCMRLDRCMPENNGLSIPIDAEKAGDIALAMDEKYRGEKQTNEVMAMFKEYTLVNLFPDDVVIEEDEEGRRWLRSINDSIRLAYFDEFEKQASVEDVVRFHRDMAEIYRKRKSETEGSVVDKDEKGNLFLEMIAYHEKKAMERNLKNTFAKQGFEKMLYSSHILN